MAKASTCPKCGAELPGEALEGLCPRCLGQVVFGLSGASSVVVPVSEKAGDRIGRYKLLQQIGEGGYGVVYMAEQEEPVRRRVAFKLIKLGMDTKDVVARFEAERQALAMMDHPNIAMVLDGGATETGRPYFVMELVRGTRITDYCDQNNLPTVERLKLFMQVCHAVQHAHQKGIIHRDIKPSNILVSLHDDVPVPKVIDFGIAKAMGERLTEKTLYTRFGQFIGTPTYMSPEQAGVSPAAAGDIDTRSDIYALGVLLYELLTGRTPFDSRELARAGLEEMLRCIREREPPKPSTRLSKLQHEELTTTAQRRQTEPPKLINLLRGDLDWIVMKCLEKNRARRYETANGLAADIEHHLKHEPVTAAAPGALYRFQKFVQRNRAVLTMTSALFLLLLAGVAVSTWQAVRATRAERTQSQLRQQAEREQQKAQTEAAKSRQVAQFLQEMLKGVGPSVALGRDTTMLQEILDKTAQRVGQDLTNQPEVEAELRSTLAETYFDLLEYKKAEAMNREALRLREAVFGNKHPAVADSLVQLSGDLLNLGKDDEAENLLRQALATYREVLGHTNEKVATVIHNLGNVLEERNKLAEAEALYREALAMNQSVLGHDHSFVVDNLALVGLVRMRRGDLVEAEAKIRESLDICRRIFPSVHPRTAGVLVSLGCVLLEERGQLAEAESLFREALTMNKTLLGKEHVTVAGSLYNLALTLDKQGKLVEAETMHREALAMRKTLLGTEHRDVDDSLAGLARCLARAGKLAEAEAVGREELATEKKLSGEQHPFVANSLGFLANVLRAQGKLAEAEAMLRDTLARFKKMLDPAHKDVLNLLKDLAGLLTVVGKLAEAEALYLEVLEANPQSQTALRNLESLLALPALTPLMADAHANPAPWRYTVAEPATNWLKADFPDDRWPMGSAVFGTPDCLPRTLWTNSDIWLRREFTLAEVPAGLIFLCLRHNSAVHDDDARIFLNGLEAAHESGAIEEYALLPLSPAARAALKSGRNVAAVHCRATNRLNFKCIDVGLYLTPDLQIGKKRLIERLGQAIQDQPQSTNLLRLRADLLARLGRWQEAAGDLRKVIELDPSDQWDWYRSAVLLLQIGDVPACRIHCQRMVDRFGADTNAAVLERTAKACLAVPGGRADLNTVSQLAEKAVNLGTNQILSYHFEFTKSLAAYRRGQFAQAAQGIRQVIGQPGDVGGTSEDYFGEICANAVLAMALHQMKQPEEARATLAQAVKIADTRLAKLDDGDLGGSWYDWLTAHILLREAKELIEKK